MGEPTILVATPGRLNDYLEEEDVRPKFNDLQTLILDEADRMLDAGRTEISYFPARPRCPMLISLLRFSARCSAYTPFSPSKEAN